MGAWGPQLVYSYTNFLIFYDLPLLLSIVTVDNVIPGLLGQMGCHLISLTLTLK